VPSDADIPPRPPLGLALQIPHFEDTPLTRSEYIAAMVHFYRGEVYRATQWRLRLDNTTNWSILSTMGVVTFSFGDNAHPHAAILLGMLLVATFLNIEARRFRFFDVWQRRVRLIERNFYGPLLRRDLQSPNVLWGQLIAEDLLHPRFGLTQRQAVRARLVRNYLPIYAILLGAWALKLALQEPRGDGWWHRMAVGALPWWVAPLFVAVVYGWLAAVLLLVRKPHHDHEREAVAHEHVEPG
jgi:uncharacterized membrane protein